MIDSILEPFTKKISENLLNYFTKKQSAMKIYDINTLEKFMNDYLIKHKSIYYVKTLVNAEKGKYLLDIYSPMELGHEDLILPQELSSIKSISNKVIISGVGGMGKSILMKKMFLDTITSEDDWNIPIFIELRNLLIPKEDIKNIDFFEKIILTFFSSRGLQFHQKDVEMLLNDGKLHILLDGLDEVKSEHKRMLTMSLDTFIKKYDNNFFALSSRPLSKNTSWGDFETLNILPLKRKNAIELIKKSFNDSSNSTRFIQMLESRLFYNYEELIGIPLLLIVMYLTYNYNGEIPHTTIEFYSKAFSTMYNVHDSSKDESFIREKKTALSQKEFEEIFQSMCFFSYLDEVYSFGEFELTHYISRGIESLRKLGYEKEIYVENYSHDLVFILCFLINENDEFKFIHRSFQEYYAAEFLKKFPDEKQTAFFTKRFDVYEEGQDSFLYYLKQLEPERYIHNFIYHGIKSIIDAYNDYRNDECSLYIEDNIATIYLDDFDYSFHKAIETIARNEFYDSIAEIPQYKKLPTSITKYYSPPYDFPITGISDSRIQKHFIEHVFEVDLENFQAWIEIYERKLNAYEFSDFDDFIQTL